MSLVGAAVHGLSTVSDKVRSVVGGGFTPGAHGIDAIAFGYYDGGELVFLARTRNGFVRQRAVNFTHSLNRAMAIRQPS